MEASQKLDLSQEITVVIITRDRADSITRVLAELRALPEKFPIIVIDNASRDGTARTIRANFPEVQVIALRKNRGAIGRNIGVKEAKTPYIAFCDDDSWWGPSAMPRAIECFKKYPKVAIIAGEILVNKEEKLDPCCALLAKSPLPRRVAMPGPAILGFIGCGVFARRSAFEEVGGYNKWISFSGEEKILAVELASRGWGLTYASDVVGYHYPYPYRKMVRRYQMGLRNRIWFAWLRRPVRSAIWASWQEVKMSLRRPTWSWGLIESLWKMPIILRHRKVVPSEVEEDLKMLEGRGRRALKLKKSVSVGELSVAARKRGTVA